MSVRAKFKVDSYETTIDWRDKTKEVRAIKLSPVVGGSKENDSFYAATPSGNIVLSIINEDAWKNFELGKEYYVDFTVADAH